MGWDAALIADLEITASARRAWLAELPEDADADGLPDWLGGAVAAAAGVILDQLPDVVPGAPCDVETSRGRLVVRAFLHEDACLDVGAPVVAALRAARRHGGRGTILVVALDGSHGVEITLGARSARLRTLDPEGITAAARRPEVIDLVARVEAMATSGGVGSRRRSSTPATRPTATGVKPARATPAVARPRKAPKRAALGFDPVPRMLFPYRRSDGTTGWTLTARHVPLGVDEVLALLDDPRVVDHAPDRLEMPAKRTCPNKKRWLVGDAGASAIAACSGLSGLRELLLDEVGIGPAGARALAASAALRDLRVLDLDGNPLGDEGLVALAGATFHGLEDLRLATGEGRKYAGAVGLGALARAFPRLRRLDLWGHEVAEHAGLLAGAAFAGSLVDLSLRGTGTLTPAAARAMGAGRLGEGLRALELGATEVGPAALTALAAGSWPALRSLKLLDVPGHRDKPHAAMAELARLPALGELDAPFDALAHGGFACLRTTDLTQRLQVLHTLEARGAGAKALRPLFAEPWPHLRELRLGETTDALGGARLPALESLVGSFLGPDGVATLATVDAPRLRRLRITSTPMAAADVEGLLARTPVLEDLELQLRADAGPPPDLRSASCRATVRRLRLGSLDPRQLAAVLAPGWPSLRALGVEIANGDGDVGPRVVAAAPCAPQLEVLRLGYSKLAGAAPMEPLANGPFASLRALHLLVNPIGDEGAEVLANATNLPALRFLEMRGTGMSRDAIAKLVASPHLPALEEVAIGEGAPAKGVVVDAPPQRIVGQGSATRSDDGLDRLDAAYY